MRSERQTNHAALYLTECTWMRKRGWRTPDWKLIEALEPDFHGLPPVELYNLAEDPGEQRNLAESEPVVVGRLRAQMRTWVQRRLWETGASDPIMEYRLGIDRKIGPITRGLTSLLSTLRT